jgi:hypothetical protein
MTQSIAAIAPSAPIRDPETAPRALDHDTLEQANIWESDDGASFGDLLDAINPLHHLPVVSQIYRAVTDDAIGLAPRLIGAAIFGGPLGFLIAGISAFFEQISGGTVSEHALALLDDRPGDRPGGDAYATATAAPFKPLEPGQADGGVGAPHPTSATPAAETRIAEIPATQIPATQIPPGQIPPGQIPPDQIPPGQVPAVKTPAAPTGIDDKRVSIAPPQAAAMIAAAPSPNVPSTQIKGNPGFDLVSKRISQSLLRSQRAQVDLLLANLRGHDAVKLPTRGDGDDGRAHSNMPPDGAREAWYADAMLRALDKYRSGHDPMTGGP